MGKDGMPRWMPNLSADGFGVGRTTDQQFGDVFDAIASHNRRPRISPEEQKRREAEAHKRDPQHIAAMKRRKKRKNGGPK